MKNPSFEQIQKEILATGGSPVSEDVLIGELRDGMFEILKAICIREDVPPTEYITDYLSAVILPINVYSVHVTCLEFIESQRKRVTDLREKDEHDAADIVVYNVGLVSLGVQAISLVFECVKHNMEYGHVYMPQQYVEEYADILETLTLDKVGLILEKAYTPKQ